MQSGMAFSPPLLLCFLFWFFFFKDFFYICVCITLIPYLPGQNNKFFNKKDSLCLLWLHPKQQHLDNPRNNVYQLTVLIFSTGNQYKIRLPSSSLPQNYSVTGCNSGLWLERKGNEFFENSTQLSENKHIFAKHIIAMQACITIFKNYSVLCICLHHRQENLTIKPIFPK